MSETLGVCARLCVCAAVVSVSSAEVCFFFADGIARAHALRPGTAFRPGRVPTRAD